MGQDENPLHILLAGLTTPLCCVLFYSSGCLVLREHTAEYNTYSDIFHHTLPTANDVVLFMFQ